MTNDDEQKRISELFAPERGWDVSSYKSVNKRPARGGESDAKPTRAMRREAEKVERKAVQKEQQRVKTLLDARGLRVDLADMSPEARAQYILNRHNEKV